MKSDFSEMSRIENLKMSLNNLNNKGKPNQQHPKK
jgi:hypothetical protein